MTLYAHTIMDDPHPSTFTYFAMIFTIVVNGNKPPVRIQITGGPDGKVYSHLEWPYSLCLKFPSYSIITIIMVTCCQVLEQRQVNELLLLDSNFETEKQLKIDQGLTDLKIRYETEKEDLISKHNMQLQEFVPNSYEKDFDSKMASILHVHQMKLSHLEHTFLEDCEKTKASITAHLATKHARDKIVARERYYQVGPV